MREIVFRGIKKGKNHFVYGNLSIKFDMAFIQIYLEDTRSYEDVEVEPETVGEFIGLPDKNGKDIYEGNLLKLDSGRKVVVIFKNGAFGYEIDSDFMGLNNLLALSGYDWDIEVIGTIHDNPELQEVGE